MAYNNMKSHFSVTANIFVGNFSYDYWINIEFNL